MMRATFPLALACAIAMVGCKAKEPGCVEGAYACGGATLYQCVHTKAMAVAACEGALGCAEEAGQVRCDQSEATVGSRCVGEGRHACARDHLALLRCVDSGVFEVERGCGGELKCAAHGAEIVCDDGVAEIGVPCDGRGVSFACSGSRDAILKCVGKAYAVSERCDSPRRCAIENDQIGCKAP